MFHLTEFPIGGILRYGVSIYIHASVLVELQGAGAGHMPAYAWPLQWIISIGHWSLTAGNFDCITSWAAKTLGELWRLYIERSAALRYHRACSLLYIKYISTIVILSGTPGCVT
jgi:hypothetical protein